MNKHQYIQKICEAVASKSTCFKRQVGAVFINEDFEILATGYNSSPKGFPNCDMEVVFGGGKNRTGTCGDPCHRTIHAEQNAIVQAAKRGQALKGSTLYCTYIPCVTCARLIVNLGVQLVMYKEFNSDGGRGIFSEACINCYQWDELTCLEVERQMGR